LKRKSGDLFSGTSKQRALSQNAPESLHWQPFLSPFSISIYRFVRILH
jgi:hypothetical protein